MKYPKRPALAAVISTVLACLGAESALAQLSAPPPPINTYVGDPGTVGDPANWRTPEFNRDVGMVSIGAEFAYAAGYSGTEMNVGIVDSGTFAGHMREHGSLATNHALGDRKTAPSRQAARPNRPRASTARPSTTATART